MCKMPHPPCQVRENTVSGAGQHFTVDGTELFCTVTKGDNLSWADKGAANIIVNI